MRAISDIRRNSMATAMENAGGLLQFEKMIRFNFLFFKSCLQLFCQASSSMISSKSCSMNRIGNSHVIVFNCVIL